MTIRRQNFSCSRDGLVLRGTAYLPEGCAAKESGRLASAPPAPNRLASAAEAVPYRPDPAGGRGPVPAALVCHGFMVNQGTVHSYAKALAGAGYAAFCFDFAGGCVIGGKSDGKTTDMSVLTEVDDLLAVLDYVCSLPFVDADDVLLMGCSQGGLVAALAAARRPREVARLALFYPALCIPDDARAGKMMFARFDPSDVPERFWCGPMRLGRRYATDVMDMDPFSIIASYSGPVLIVHGERDRVVAPRYAQRALEVYRTRSAPGASVELLMLEGAGHGFTGGAALPATAALLRFCARG